MGSQAVYHGDPISFNIYIVNVVPWFGNRTFIFALHRWSGGFGGYGDEYGGGFPEYGGGYGSEYGPGPEEALFDVDNYPGGQREIIDINYYKK